MGLAPPTAPAGAGVQAGRGLFPALCVRHISLLFLFPLLSDTFMVLLLLLYFLFSFLALPWASCLFLAVSQQLLLASISLD